MHFNNSKYAWSKTQLHWGYSTVFTSKTIDWSEITRTGNSKELREVLDPAGVFITSPHRPESRDISDSRHRRGKIRDWRKRGDSVCRHVINESAGVPWTYRPVHLSEKCCDGRGKECATGFSVSCYVDCCPSQLFPTRPKYAWVKPPELCFNLWTVLWLRNIKIKSILYCYIRVVKKSY